MLVLSRKASEAIVINNEITLMVVEIRGDKVRLGIEAPKHVPVHRKEVHDAIAAKHGLDFKAYMIETARAQAAALSDVAADYQRQKGG